MAHMHPLHPHSSTVSQAEIALHGAFAKQLSDDFTIFHSAKWQARDEVYGVHDAEADFLILHRARGLLVMEVKGGNILLDGATGIWTSNGKEIPNPIAQARNNKYKLIEWFNSLPRWQGRVPRIEYAVAFPDVPVHDLGAEIAPELLLGNGDMNSLAPWMARAFDYAMGTAPVEPISGESIKTLIDRFSPSRRLYGGIGGEIRTEERSFVELTEGQYDLLRSLGSNRRVAIEGCAGSGKTMLAIEQARRLAAEGNRVLFVCYNRFLPERLRTHPSLEKGVEVYHFHGLCEAMAMRAGIPVPARDGAESDYFNTVLPGLLIDAIGVLGAQYDAIVVDEGQDMRDEWWTLLEEILEPEAGYFFVFHDPSQNLYDRKITLPERMVLGLVLRKNCRNTRKIHDTVASYYEGEFPPEPYGPLGRDPEVLLYADARSMHLALATLLKRLTSDENVRTEDIVILTQRKIERTSLRDKSSVGAFGLTQQWPPKANQIFVNTIYQFKGMESPVVILAEVTESQHQNLDTLLYVGCSRAKNHLVILAPNEMRGILNEHFANMPA